MKQTRLPGCQGAEHVIISMDHRGESLGGGGGVVEARKDKHFRWLAENAGGSSTAGLVHPPEPRVPGGPSLCGRY